ncbi:MAG: hypothetical protein L0Y71_24400 [Gemmataceae bacterium]|nr:hypothetical protein [Gemmataceae bacterium]
MEHYIPCTCGDGVTVPETAAGTTVPCTCGRTVTVPSFRELRQRSGLGEPQPPAAMVIESLLLAQELPQERECVLCGIATDHVVSCRTICEQAYVETGDRPWWQVLIAAVTFGWLFALIFAADRKPAQEFGNDRIYSLPLRVCDRCVPQLSNATAVKEALGRAPLYRRLLAEYPDTVVELPVLKA